MNEIKKNIIKVILLGVFLIISVPFWKNYSDGLIKKTNAMLVSGENIVIKNDGDNALLYPITNERAINKYNKKIIEINNNSLQTNSFDLYLVIDKSSTLEDKYLNCYIDNEIISLNSLYQYEDNTSKYYLIKTVKLNKNDNQDIEYLMWLDINSGNSVQGKSITYSFFARANDNILAMNT